MGLVCRARDKNLRFSLYNSTGIQGTVTYRQLPTLPLGPDDLQKPSILSHLYLFVMISPNLVKSQQIFLWHFKLLALQKQFPEAETRGLCRLANVEQERDGVQDITLELITHFCITGNTNLLCLKPVCRESLAAKGKRDMILLFVQEPLAALH